MTAYLHSHMKKQLCRDNICARLLAVVLAAFTILPFASAQREKNNIFLFDCTNSMLKGGLWQPAKDALDATIMSQAATSEAQFIIIPFGDVPYGEMHFNNSDYVGKKGAINKCFDDNIRRARTTNISSVLTAAFAKCDPKKDNKIYLLTDGLPNGSDSPQKVSNLIQQWCGNHKNARLYYVALKNGVVPGEIQQVIDLCDDAYVVQCDGKAIPQISDIALPQIHANINELETPYILQFSESECGLKVHCDDPIFDAKIIDGRSVDGKIGVQLRGRDGQDVAQLHQQLQQKIQPGGDYRFTIKITSDDPRYIIANPEVSVFMADHIQSRLTLADGANELAADGASWHDSFLWSKASAPGEVKFDLAPKFKNVSAPETELELMLTPSEGENVDYQCYYNGRELGEDETFTVTPKSAAELRIVFNRDAKTGKRYFNLVNCGSKNLDIVNDAPISEFNGLTLRSKYSVRWNPLKTFLLWIAIAVLAVLVLWFLLLRRIIYPTIKVKKIEFAGPGTFYASYNVKGARKVVFTNKKQSQGVISRIFTGNIRYVRAEHFSPAIELLPSGSKKKVRLHSLNRGDDTWIFTPGAILAPFDKIEMHHQGRNETAEISIL